MATSNSPPSVNVAKYFGVNRKWSKETILADHKDLQASAMGVSHHDNGQFAVLGGRRYGNLRKFLNITQILREINFAQVWIIKICHFDNFQGL